ncbi:metallophosphoesterase family protein [bacterium]|nr:metallophosphoesterase family protein [bacterium]
MWTPIRRSLAALILLAAASAAPAAVVTRGPYLQMPRPTGMVVRWRTDVPTTSRVSYGDAPTSLFETVDDPTLTTEHEIALTGLTAGTTAYYAVGEIGLPLAGGDADHYLRTPPPTGSSQPYRLWAIGDAGFTGPDLDAVRDAFIAYNGGPATDLFLLLGDNAYLFATDAQYQAAVFDEHAAMLRTTPVWSVFGNHEILSSNPLTQTGPYFAMFTFPTAAQLGGVASGSEAYFSFDYGNTHFIVLDSEEAPTSPSTPMLTWLTADLQAAVLQNPTWIIATWHRPPYSKGQLHDSDTELGEIRMRQYVLPILDTYGVDVVFSGHSHSYERSYLLDGHYGLSPTFNASFKVEPGDGDPAGDGAYRKVDTGPAPHSGTVYVVSGSGSEVRTTTLNHPAMVRGLLELGSVVLDVDDTTLTARFLTSTGAIHDTFRIVKGLSCPPAPATGCGAAPKGKLLLAANADPSKDKWQWKWKGGALDAAAVGDPSGQTDLAVCVYDAGGALVGGAIPHGTAGWTAKPTSLAFKDDTLALHGLNKITLKFTAGMILAKAKGANAAVPTLPVTAPLKAQLVNLDSGACWESVFATAKKNTDKKVIAVAP